MYREAVDGCTWAWDEYGCVGPGVEAKPWTGQVSGQFDYQVAGDDCLYRFRCSPVFSASCPATQSGTRISISILFMGCASPSAGPLSPSVGEGYSVIPDFGNASGVCLLSESGCLTKAACTAVG